MIGSFLWMAAALVQAPEPPRYGGFLAQIDGLEEPSAVAVGPGDEIFVVERFAHRVRVFDATGRELRRFGSLGHGPTDLLEPQGLAIAPDGRVLVADTGHDEIGGYSPAGGALGRLVAQRSSRWEIRRPLGLDALGERVVVANERAGNLALYAPAEAPQNREAWRLGTLGDGAGLERPVDVAFGEDGSFFVADSARHEVVHLGPDGAARRAWGGFGAYPGQFVHPSGIDVAAGRVYVADRENHRVQVFDAEGRHLYAWGVHALRPHEGGGRIHYPNDVAIAPSGAFAVVCEGFENRVQVFGPETDESVLRQQQQERTTAAHFGFGISVAADVMAVVEPSAPDLLVYDLTQEEPIEISRVGMHGARIGTLRQPVDVELDETGELAFCADADARRIDLWRIARAPGEELRYDPLLGRLVQSYDLAVERALGLRKWSPYVVEPVALELDGAGGLWLVDAAGAGVLRLGLRREEGGIVGFAVQAGAPVGFGWCGPHFGFRGSNQGPWQYAPGARDAELALRIPTDLAFSRDREILYVVDAGEQRVEAYRVADVGAKPRIEHAFAFGDGAGPGRLSRPTGVAAGRDGFVYVTDEGAHRILKFDERGAFVASFGRQGLGKVEFYKPRGIDQGPDGNLYVVDYGNHRGQVLTPDGAFVKAFGSRLFLQPILQGK